MAARDDASNSVRELLRGSLQKAVTAEYLDDLLAEVKASTKQSRGHCPDCRRMVFVQTPDHAKTVSMLGDLFDQATGKPGTAAGAAAGVALIVERCFPMTAKDLDELEAEERAVVEKAVAIVQALPRKDVSGN